MRIISIKTLRDFWMRHPEARKPLKDWFRVAEAAQWRNFADVRQTLVAADTAKVASGHTVTIFDIGGKKFRLIAAVHYNTGVVYALMVLTHPEYDAGKWKARL